MTFIKSNTTKRYKQMCFPFCVTKSATKSDNLLMNQNLFLYSGMCNNNIHVKCAEMWFWLVVLWKNFEQYQSSNFCFNSSLKGRTSSASLVKCYERDIYAQQTR